MAIATKPRSHARQFRADNVNPAKLASPTKANRTEILGVRRREEYGHDSQNRLCVLGIVLPYSQFVPWVVAHHGVPLGFFIRELFANRIGAFFGLDVLVSAVVLIFFIRREGQRLCVRRLWLPIVGTLAVGVSLGFPLFLYLRKGALERGPCESAVVTET